MVLVGKIKKTLFCCEFLNYMTTKRMHNYVLYQLMKMVKHTSNLFLISEKYYSKTNLPIRPSPQSLRPSREVNMI